MPTMMFVNLPVADLERSKEFFGALGYSFNPQFTDENAACLVISDTIFAMLLTHEWMRRFTTKAIADATATTEAILSLSADSREAVDELVDRALAAGGKATRDPEDLGFMYSRSFEDPDGHQWESLWMNPEHVQ